MALSVISCSDSNSLTGPSDPPTPIPQPPTGPLVLHDNVVAIDSTVLTLVSSEAEFAAGTYRFDIIGSPVPTIEVGDVLAGPEGLGFMGIVTSVTAGSQVVAQTTQASLSDIIKAGSFSISEPLNLSIEPPPPGSALAPLYYMAPGMSSSGRLFELTDIDLCELAKLADQSGCPEWLSLTLPSGYVDLTAEFELDFESQFLTNPSNPVKLFRTVVKGDLVFDVSARAVASQAFSTDGEVVLKEIPVPVPLPYGLGLILKPTAVIKLMAGYEANANVEARVQSGIHLETGVELGGEYTHANGGVGVWNPTFSAAAKETSWAAQGNGDIRVYVRPEVQFVMNGVEGPLAGMEPYLKGYGEIGTEGCRARLTWAVDAEVVLNLKLANIQLPSIPFAWPGTETELLNILCPNGHLKVVTTTSGLSPDPDGYTVTLDEGDPRPITSMGSVMYSPLPPTSYSVKLTDIADNCTVSLNPREINVSAGDTTLVAFPVICTDPAGSTGGLQVSAMTTGEDDGYTVVVDGDLGAAQALDIDGMTTFASLTSGNHSIELTDFGPNCVVSGDNPRTVTVVLDATISTDFEVACGLTVSVTTTGTDPDPDGYSVVVDGGSPTAIADINGSLWLDIAAGTRSVELIDVADNCTVTGENPGVVNAPGEETFEVTCSASGSVITFTRDFDVWQINPDGTGEQQLTTDGVGFSYAYPDWSPDGSRMAFSRLITCGTISGDCVAIFTSDADGSNLTQVTFPTVANVAGGDGQPKWSADGTRIVFSRAPWEDNRTAQIMTVNWDGTNLSELLAGNGVDTWPSYPSWAPDGGIIYVETHIAAGECLGFIKVMNADGSGSQALTGDLSCSISLPRFSPDGTRIVFSSDPAGGGAYDIYIMDADGSNITNLTAGAYTDPFWTVWSPDGASIVFVGRAQGDDGGIWLMDADGNNKTKLTAGVNDLYPAWRTLP